MTRDAGAESASSEDADKILADLFAVIEERKETLPEDSYTTSLLDHEKGVNAVLEKLGEETTELLLATKDGRDEEIAHEAADVVYHLLVVLAAEEVDVSELLAELRNRRDG